MQRVTKSFLVAALIFPALAAAQNIAPVAEAGADKDVSVNQRTELWGSAIDADGQAVAAWQWTVDSAPAGSSPYLSNANGRNLDFMADVAGDYVLSLTASDGTSWSAPDQVTIHVSELLPPAAKATARVTSGSAPLSVRFDGSGSSDPQGEGLTYEWNFGDESVPSADASPQHVYQTPGDYTATLTVYDSLGQYDFDSVNITATEPNNPPTVYAGGMPASGTAPLTVTFSASGTDPEGGTLTYAWSFGDGYSGTGQNPVHTYTSSGTFVAALTVSDGTYHAVESVTIVVSPAEAVTTTQARVEQDLTTRADEGAISYEANIDLPRPGPDDVIAFSFDGSRFFSQPFGNFLPGQDPDTYVLVGNNLLVRIDLAASTLFVFKDRSDLKTVHHSNGIDVELGWGTETVVDQFAMTRVADYLWTYER
jgi:PKD repeat protein